MGPDTSILIEPEVILSSWNVTKHGERFEEWIIRWKDKPTEEATWEKVNHIRTQFPTFCLEDKAVSAEESIDIEGRLARESKGGSGQTKPKIVKVYSRKPKNLQG